MKLTLEKAIEMMAANHGNLDLQGSEYTELPEGLIVCGSLYLRKSAIAELPANLIVGGSLDIRATQITNQPEGLAIGNTLYIGEHQKHIRARQLMEGEYVPGKYLYTDYAVVIPESSEAIEGYTFFIGRLEGWNAISDGRAFARCKALSDGIEKLMLKSAPERGADRYRDLAWDAQLTAAEAAEMYRSITGASEQQAAAFLGDAPKEQYTLGDCFNLAEGKYGCEALHSFFGYDD